MLAFQASGDRPAHDKDAHPRMNWHTERVIKCFAAPTIRIRISDISIRYAIRIAP